MSTVERLREILSNGSFNWEEDEVTLRDALRLLESFQAARLERYLRENPSATKS